MRASPKAYVPPPSAPPLPSPWEDDVATVNVYAMPVAVPVASSPPSLPPPPPPPPRTSVDERHQLPSRAPSSSLAVQAHAEQDCCPSVWPALWFAAHLGAYHIANATLAFVAALLVYGGLVLSLVLFPLCGFGIAILSATIRTCVSLAEIDARFHNTIAPHSDMITFPDDDERQPLLPLHDPQRTSPVNRPAFASHEFESMSPRTLLLLLYFGVVKIVLGILSALGFGLAIVFFLALISDDPHVHVELDDRTSWTLDIHGWSTLVFVAAAVVCVMELHIVGHVALAATRWFTCERRL